MIFRLCQEGRTAHLGHGLQNQRSGHHVLLGKMAAEKLLIDADALDAPGPLPRLTCGDPVYQGEGIAVGQQLRNLVGI